jgi:hypothetical protein
MRDNIVRERIAFGLKFHVVNLHSQLFFKHSDLKPSPVYQCLLNFHEIILCSNLR